MRLGLGTGRAAEAFIRKLGERARAGLDVIGVATSRRSEAVAAEVGVPTATLAAIAPLDLALDGADEVAPDLSVLKGLGGAHLRERVVAAEAARLLLLVTPEKLVGRLGERAPVPVELVEFALATASRRLAAIAGATGVTRRLDRAAGAPFVTDNGNPVVDVAIAPTDDAAALDAAIRRVPGVVDTGFFLGMADLVLVGEPGRVRELVRP
jgi:ribose 5-phosphate isomerase A